MHWHFVQQHSFQLVDLQSKLVAWYRLRLYTLHANLSPTTIFTLVLFAILMLLQLSVYGLCILLYSCCLIHSRKQLYFHVSWQPPHRSCDKPVSQFVAKNHIEHSRVDYYRDPFRRKYLMLSIALTLKLNFVATTTQSILLQHNSMLQRSIILDKVKHKFDQY